MLVAASDLTKCHCPDHPDPVSHSLFRTTGKIMPEDVRFSQHAGRAADQAIGFLMQQAVENADCISLAAGLVDELSLPVDITRQTVDELLSDQTAGRRVLQYGITPGPEPLRRIFRDYLAKLECDANGLRHVPLSQLMLTTGSQQLLNLITQALFDPGDICLVAAPTYFVFMGVLQAAGARIIPIPSDDDGMIPQELERALAKLEAAGDLHRVRLVYVVSYFENPSGISLSEERRPEILAITQRFSKNHRILLLEDAAYRELRYEGDAHRSIWSWDTDHETVILAQTFSKSFSPGLRVGLGVLPKALVKPVSDLKGNDDFGSAHLNQHIVARVLRSGAYYDHVDRVRASYRKKRDAMLRAVQEEFGDLPGVTWVRPKGGMYVWMRLPDEIRTGFDSPLFRQATQVNKVMYVPGELSYPADWISRPRSEMRLSFGVQTEEGIVEGIRRLAGAVRTVMKQFSNSPAGSR